MVIYCLGKGKFRQVSKKNKYVSIEMFVLSKDKPTRADYNSKYFPVASIGLSKNPDIFIKEIPYGEYTEKIEFILEQEIKNENDRDELFSYMEERILPRGKYRKKVSAMISVLDEVFNRVIKVSRPDFFMKVPNPITRDAINIYGQAGSGKTYWASLYAKQYRKKFPKADIYLITTNVENDPLYKGLKIKKLDISNRDLLDDYNFNETTFADSLVIFDDIEHNDAGIYMWIRKLRDMLFLKSRKHNVDIINIIHKGLDNKNSNTPNNECTGGVFFPRYGWSEAKKILTNYFNINSKQMEYINKSKKNSRWVYVHKVFPKYMITEQNIIMLD